jgi:murein DD-endopeptidase MepM/ murein hydrolase activator NlpD
MSIFKESFKKGVQDQILTRQKAIASNPRSAQTIQYFNSRNAWIRMTSAVDVSGDKGALARKNVLAGGVLNYNPQKNSYSLKSGVGSGNESYSTTTAGGVSHRLGIRPMPGITSVQVRSKSAYGSLREAVVSFQCWDIRQLEELELLYMRPGYSVLLEWGWVPYLDNSGDLQTNAPISDYLFSGASKEVIWSELFKRSSADGNFDSIYGFIKNFSWSARADGGYDCSTTLITMGEVLESLKVNYGAFDVSDLQTKGLFPVTKPASAFQSNTQTSTIKDDVADAYAQNIIAGICAELYNITIANSTVASSKVAAYNLVDKNNKNYTYNFLKYSVTFQNMAGPTITDGDQQIYIRLADFVEILNRYVILSDKTHKTPISKLSVQEAPPDYAFNQTGSLLQCLGDIHQVSTNPYVCLIKNTSYDNPKTSLGVEGLNVKTINQYMSAMTYNYLDINTQFGTIGNIYVNLDYLYGLAANDILNAQDKKEKNDLILFDYIKSVMSGINTAIGSVANFDIFIDPVDSVARIIDVNYVDNTSRDKAYDNAFEIQIQNLKSIVRNYSYQSQIFPEMSSIIAIGAQAQGGALGEDTNTLVDFNKNLVDRVIPKKDSPTAPFDTDANKELEIKLNNLQQNWANIAEYFIELNPDWWFSGDYDIEQSSKYANSLKDIIGFFKSITNNPTKNRAVIPTKLSLEIDGIGGIIIGNLFKIPKDIVPKGYGGDLNYNTTSSAGPEKLAYTVTGLNHNLQNNDWTTTIDAQFIILDEPKGYTGSIPIVQAINRVVTTASPGAASNIINNAAPPPSTTSPYGFALPVSVPYNINSLLTRARQKNYNRSVTTGTDSNHQGLDLQGPRGGTQDTAASALMGGKGTTGDGIFAVADGIVKKVGPASGFGYWIYIQHTINNETFTSIYGHMPEKSITVNVGDKVTKTQQIALIGNEGTSTGYHLHFELWKGDRKDLLDPMDYLPFFKTNGGDIADNVIVTPGKQYP